MKQAARKNIHDATDIYNLYALTIGRLLIPPGLAGIGLRNYPRGVAQIYSLPAGKIAPLTSHAIGQIEQIHHSFWFDGRDSPRPLNCVRGVLFDDFAFLVTFHPPTSLKSLRPLPFRHFASMYTIFFSSEAALSSSAHQFFQSARIFQDLRFLCIAIPSVNCVVPALYMEEKTALILSIWQTRSFSLRAAARM